MRPCGVHRPLQAPPQGFRFRRHHPDSATTPRGWLNSPRQAISCCHAHWRHNRSTILATIRPFCGIHYALRPDLELSRLIAPPYDVLDEAAKAEALQLAQRLRPQFRVELSYALKKPGKALEEALKRGAKYVGFLGEGERPQQEVSLKHLSSGHQVRLEWNDVARWLGERATNPL
ncbi:MAG: hypothetical protein K6T57_14515 [Thermaceae bacterium]|nr:hypothetical protein [Thermaceae bacterium]